MAKFPTIERRVGLSGGSTGSYADAGAFTAGARALQGAGADLAQLGNNVLAVEDKIRQTQDNTWVSKTKAQTALDMIGEEQRFQTDATDGAKDYTPKVRGSFDAYRKTKLKEAPSPRAAQMYQEWSDAYDVDLTRRSATFQAGSELAKRTADLSDTMNLHAQAVLADPSQYETVRTRAMVDLDAAKAWMTPEQEVAAREKVDHDLQLARAKSIVEFRPGDFIKETGGEDSASVAGDAAIDVVTDKIIGVESGGNPNAKNPKSSASGVGQFLDATWLKTVRSHRPDLAGQSDGALLALKSNRKLGREMTRALAADNAKALSAAGMPATAGNLYLAHFAGTGGAKAVLSSDNGRSVEDVLGPAVIKANPFLAGKNVGWLKNWAAKKMGGKTINVAGNPAYSTLSVDELLALQGRADVAVKTEQTTAYAGMKGTLELGVQTGEVMDERTILDSALNDDDKATLLSKFRTVRKDELAVADTIAALQAGGLSVDPYDTDARKNVDGAAAALKKKATPEQYMIASEEIVRQSGIVPKDVVNEIRRGLESTNAQEVAAAAQRAQRIATIDPAALGRRDGGKEAQDAAASYQHYTDTVGLDPQQAAKRLIDLKDPEKVRARASLMESKPIKDFVKGQAVESTVRDIFDPGFGFDPKLGETPAQSAAMVGEYRSILEESIFDSGGDTDLAKVLAASRFQERYGPSELTLSGPGVVTRLPPEKAYPAGFDGTHGYIREQAIEALAGEGITASEVFLQADTMTEQDVKAGKPARYQVFYREPDGDLERFMLPFFAAAPSREDIGLKQIEESRGRRDENLAIKERTEKVLEGSGMQNSPLMSTDPDAVNPSPGLGDPWETLLEEQPATEGPAKDDYETRRERHKRNREILKVRD